MGDVASPQYPTAPAPSTNLLMGNPLQVIGAANAVTQLRANQQALAARQATGAAFQGAMNDDGSIDQGKLSNALRASPEAAYSLPEVSQQMLTQASGQNDLDTARTKFGIDAIGALADDPHLSRDKVISTYTTLARNLKWPAAAVNETLDTMPKGGAALRNWVLTKRNLAIGSTNLSTPTTTGITPEGAPITGTKGGFGYATTGGRGIQTDLGAGERPLLESNSARAGALESTADTSSQTHADLENLRQESAVMGNLGGPSQQVEKQLNQLSTRALGFGVTMSPDQLRASEGFDKLASNIALNQAKMLGGTDNTRTMAVGATPNSGMSRYGRDGVIDMLHGNQDAVDAAREAWLDAKSNGAAPGTFGTFMNKFRKNLDVRVFQFNRLDRENQQKFYSQLPAAEVPAFEARYEAGVKRGWVNKPKPAVQQ